MWLTFYTFIRCTLQIIIVLSNIVIRVQTLGVRSFCPERELLRPQLRNFQEQTYGQNLSKPNGRAQNLKKLFLVWRLLYHRQDFTLSVTCEIGKFFLSPLQGRKIKEE